MKKMKLNIQRFATVLNNKLSNGTSPYAYYTVEASYSNRTATTVDVSVSVTSNLRYSSSSFGTGNNNGLNAYFKFNGTQYGPLSLKGTKESWSGTTKHYKSATYTIRNLSTNTSNLNIQFRVDRTGSKAGTTNKSDGCWLEWTTCSSLAIETGTKYVPAMEVSLQEHPTNPMWYNMTNEYAKFNWKCTSGSAVSSISQIQITYGKTGQDGNTIYINTSGKSGEFTLEGLEGNTKYWVKVYGKSSDGIWSSSPANVTFTTYANPIYISSLTTTKVTATSITVTVYPTTTDNLSYYTYLLLDEQNSIISNIETTNNINVFNDLMPETSYFIWVSAHPYNQGSVDAEAKGINVITPADQASIYVRTNNGWQKGKVFIKTDKGWTVAKKVYARENAGWIENINS